MFTRFSQDVLLLGEGQAVDGGGPGDSPDDDEAEAGVVPDPVLHTAPLVDPQAVVNVEQLLIVLQVGVS